MKLSVNMIVKNESMFIDYVLKSLKPVAWEYIIIDNGSTDGTLEKLYKFQDENDDVVIILNNDNDFVNSRNLCMQHSSGDWILIADGDEVFYNEGENDISEFVRILEQMDRDEPKFKDVSLVHLPFYHFYGSFNHLLAAEPSPVIRVIRNNGNVKWIYPDPSVNVHEIPVDIRTFENPDLITKSFTQFRFAHLGYVKPNKDIWFKGKNYQDKGHFNHLWERSINEVLNGTEVVPFQKPYPSVMKSFPFYKHKTDFDVINGKIFIKNKKW